MTRLMLDKIVSPRRDRGFGSADHGPPWEDEVEEAQRLALRWANAGLFTVREAARWLDVHGNLVSPEQAALFAQNSITPEQAALRVWYGRINPQRPTIAQRVTTNQITVQQASEEIASLAPELQSRSNDTDAA